ncbi:MAG TPA: FecR domain-containing protein [Stellaceae bacterium]|nr:FecR domain-containing protein [Stellaceae bacterium]
MHFRIWVFSVLLLAGWAAAGTALAAAQDVGINSAVNTNATGTPPGGATQRLVIGQKVVYNEHIVTDAGGQAQILFLDESSMMIGPNSDLTIDEFVYDPRTGSGKLAMSATKGVMRFVGGKISKLENGVSMQTPSATIGIRGGVFVMDQKPAGSLNVIFVFGKGVTITGATGASQTIFRPGYEVSVAARGAVPTPPAPAPPGLLAGLFGQMDGRAGGNGGATTVPTDATVASSNVSSTISGNVSASVQAAARSAPPAPQPQSVNVANAQTNLQVNTVSTQASPAVQAENSAAFSGQYSDGFVFALTTSGTGTTVQNGFTGTLANGQLTASPQSAIPNGVTFPLPSGGSSFSNSQFSGQTFLSSDGSVFEAALSSGGGLGAPNGQTALIVGGTPLVNLPTSGVGTYAGGASASIINNTSFYTASGGFSANYNFGSQTGNMTISNLDGRTYGGPIAGAGSEYSGALSGSGVSGSAVGRFFGNNASGTGGLFAVANQSSTAAPYLAIGAFAGSR